MSCGAGLPQSRAPFYRVRAVGGGRLLVMELQGTGGECPLMTLVLGEGMRGRHRLMEGKRWGCRDDSFSCRRGGQRPAPQRWCWQTAHGGTVLRLEMTGGHGPAGLHLAGWASFGRNEVGPATRFG
jgi:hypothetical protein